MGRSEEDRIRSLNYYPCNFLGANGETHEDLSPDSRCPDSNRKSPDKCLELCRTTRLDFQLNINSLKIEVFELEKSHSFLIINIFP